MKCPYGDPGDLLCGKETWATLPEFDDLKPSQLPNNTLIGYEAMRDYALDGIHERLLRHARGRNRSSTQMPQWASRLTLELISVKVRKKGSTWWWVLKVKRKNN